MKSRALGHGFGFLWQPVLAVVTRIVVQCEKPKALNAA